jgi:hypothetical protein
MDGFRALDERGANPVNQLDFKNRFGANVNKSTNAEPELFGFYRSNEIISVMMMKLCDNRFRKSWIRT